MLREVSRPTRAGARSGPSGPSRYDPELPAVTEASDAHALLDVGDGVNSLDDLLAADPYRFEEITDRLLPCRGALQMQVVAGVRELDPPRLR